MREDLQRDARHRLHCIPRHRLLFPTAGRKQDDRLPTSKKPPFSLTTWTRQIRRTILKRGHLPVIFLPKGDFMCLKLHRIPGHRLLFPTAGREQNDGLPTSQKPCFSLKTWTWQLRRILFRRCYSQVNIVKRRSLFSQAALRPPSPTAVSRHRARTG